MWYILIIAVVAVGSLVIAVWVTRGLSKRLRDGEESSEPFTLQDLRRMLADGEITRTEYEGMRAALIGRVKKADSATARQVSSQHPGSDEENDHEIPGDGDANPK